MIMSTEYINIYMGDVHNGEQDGILVSQNDEQTSPLNIALDATINESKIVKVAIRTENGFKATHVAIGFFGERSDKWLVAKDDDYIDEVEAEEKAVFAPTLLLTEEVTDVNTVFWVKALSSVDEPPRRDTSVSIKIDSYVTAI